MILKFEDYIKEGFLSKTLSRANSGKKRLEDTHALDYICNLVIEFVQKRFDVKCSPNSCKYTELKTPKSSKSYKYQIDCDFTEWFGEEYPMFSFVILVKKQFDKQDIYQNIRQFTGGFMDVLDTYDYYGNFNYIRKLKDLKFTEDDILKFINKYTLHISNMLISLNNKGYKNDEHLDLSDLDINQIIK